MKATLKKIMPILFIVAFGLAIYFISIKGIFLLKPETEESKKAKAIYMAYYKAHHKDTGQQFTVDSIDYTITNFRYAPRADTMVLVVEITMQNNTNHNKHYKGSFFMVEGAEKKLYYPTIDAFTVFEKKSQRLHLLYFLPRNTTPTMHSELHIKSNTDTSQNAFTIFAKSYRSEG